MQQARSSCCYSCYFCCRGAKAIDELTTGLLLMPEATAKLAQAAGIQTDTAWFAEKEPVLELLLRRLATAVEALGMLSRTRWGNHTADLGRLSPLLHDRQHPLHLLLGRPATQCHYSIQGNGAAVKFHLSMARLPLPRAQHLLACCWMDLPQAVGMPSRRL